MSKSLPLVLVFLLTSVSCGPAPHPESPAPVASVSSSPAVAPVKSGPALARRDDIVEPLHGVDVADPYRWLEDGKSEETKAWLAKMDAYARSEIEKMPTRAALEKRLKELSYIESVGAPIYRGGRYFFNWRHKDKEKSILYWRESKTAEPKVLIDPNALSTDGSTSLKGWWPSHDGKLLVYELSENNADESKLHLKNVKTGQDTAIDVIPGAKYASPSWTPDGKGFYYTRLPIDPSIPTDQRPGYAAVYFHRVGDDYQKDRLVHDKTGDPKTFISVDLSHDGHFLFVSKHYGWTKDEVWFKDLRGRAGAKNVLSRPGDHPKKPFVPLAVSRKGKYRVEAHGSAIYMMTDLDAPNWRVMSVDPTKPGMDDWKELIAEKKDAVLKSVSVIGGKLVLRYLRNASSEVHMTDLNGKPFRKISLPGIGSVSGLQGNPDHDEAYYAYSSYVEPTTVYETSIAKGGKTPYFALDVPVDTSQFETKQVWFQSKDGTKVSMFIIGRKGLTMSGDLPVLLYGYGGFNVSLTPRFRASRFVWLERGGVVAIPNLRGGGEYGEAWHQGGMREKKQNVFDDYIAAAQYLIDNKYTRPGRLAIMGGSNGGLLVGAAMTQRPELYQAVVCAVPLLDMVRYHLFGSGRTWISEYGSSEDEALFKAILAYSPYHQTKAGAKYPALLMLTADSDDRVDPLHARKFVARLRYDMASDEPVLLRVETNSGHGGGDMVKKRLERNVDVYAFLLQQLGVK